MKKSLALVLALVMVLSSFSFVSAAPDFADVAGTKYESSVARLELLEILKGYPDGTFKPEGSITRAEFAAVAVRAKGLAGVAEAAAGLPSGFSDVPAWHWAAGYVGTAGSTGVVQGIGGGLFAPNAPVKYEEAVTMLVRALGYEPEAQSKGGYPFGYLVVAEEIGLLDGARSTTGTFATRGLVALLTDNAMEIPMMVSIGFGDNIRWVVSGSKEHGGDEVYLLHSLGVEEFEGIVMKNFRVDSKLDAEEIVLYDFDAEKNVTMEVSASVDIDAILGLEVTAWAKDDVVFAVTVDSDNVAYDTVSGTATEDDVDLVILDDTFDWAVRDEDYGDATVYVNNEEVDVEEAKGFGRFVMNSEDEIVFAYLFDVEDYGVVTEINDKDMDFASVLSADIETLELDEAEEIYVFTKEFAAGSIEDVKADMSVFYWIDADDNYYIVAFDGMVEGALEEVVTRTSRVTVDGTNYSKADPAIFSNDEMDTFVAWGGYAVVEDYVDEDVVVYLDFNGDAMVMVTDVKMTSTVYGVATWFSEGRTNKLSLVGADGEEVEYVFADRDGGEDKFISPDYNALLTSTSPAIKATMIKLDKDAEITTYGAITGASAANISKAADKEYVTVITGGQRLYITKDTVIMKALDSKGYLDPTVLEYDKLLDLSFTTQSAIWLTDGSSSDLALLVFTDKGFQATDDVMYGIVTVEQYTRSGEYRAEIEVSGEGKATYTLASNYGLKKGDLVKFELNNSGKAVVTATSKMADSRTNAKLVDRVLTNYIVTTPGAIESRVNADTIFYNTTDAATPALGSATSFSRIEKGDYVVVLRDTDGYAKVVVKVIGPATPADTTPANLSLSGTVDTTTDSAIKIMFKNDSRADVEFVNSDLAWTVYGNNGAVLTTSAIKVNRLVRAGAAAVELGQVTVDAGHTVKDDIVTISVTLKDGPTLRYSVTKDFTAK